MLFRTQRTLRPVCHIARRALTASHLLRSAAVVSAPVSEIAAPTLTAAQYSQRFRELGKEGSHLTLLRLAKEATDASVPLTVADCDSIFLAFVAPNIHREKWMVALLNQWYSSAASTTSKLPTEYRDAKACVERLVGLTARGTHPSSSRLVQIAVKISSHFEMVPSIELMQLSFKLGMPLFALQCIRKHEQVNGQKLAPAVYGDLIKCALSAKNTDKDTCAQVVIFGVDALLGMSTAAADAVLARNLDHALSFTIPYIAPEVIHPYFVTIVSRRMSFPQLPLTHRGLVASCAHAGRVDLILQHLFALYARYRPASSSLSPEPHTVGFAAAELATQVQRSDWWRLLPPDWSNPLLWRTLMSSLSVAVLRQPVVGDTSDQVAMQLSKIESAWSALQEFRDRVTNPSLEARAAFPFVLDSQSDCNAIAELRPFLLACANQLLEACVPLNAPAAVVTASSTRALSMFTEIPQLLKGLKPDIHSFAALGEALWQAERGHDIKSIAQVARAQQVGGGFPMVQGDLAQRWLSYQASDLPDESATRGRSVNLFEAARERQAASGAISSKSPEVPVLFGDARLHEILVRVCLDLDRSFPAALHHFGRARSAGHVMSRELYVTMLRRCLLAKQSDRIRVSEAELLIADAESVSYVVPAELKSRAKALRKAHRISKPKSEAAAVL